mmetsp:Transcript_99775/g.277630  ORF Transcript_99775/g.277630 Transcript_99775/m.277630 type:complete len:107 (-) Transcript_99775:13-333(-)
MALQQSDDGASKLLKCTTKDYEQMALSRILYLSTKNSNVAYDSWCLHDLLCKFGVFIVKECNSKNHSTPIKYRWVQMFISLVQFQPKHITDILLMYNSLFLILIKS